MLLDAYICVVVATADGTSVRGLALCLVVVITLAVETSQRFWVICTCLEPTESSKVYVSRDWSSEGAEDGAGVNFVFCCHPLCCLYVGQCGEAVSWKGQRVANNNGF